MIEGQENAIAKPTLGNQSIVSGDMPSSGGSLNISRIVLYQGTAEEEKMYGDGFKRGEFLDELERENFGTSVRIVVVGAWATFSKYVKGNKAPVYFYTSWEDAVRAGVKADFEWSGEGGKTPPVGTRCVNAIVLRYDGDTLLPMPYLVQFKRTGLPAWDGKHGIGKYEARYGACVYELSAENASNPAGQPYKRLASRMVVKLKPDSSDYKILMACRDQLADMKSQADAFSDDGGDENIPV